MTDWPPLRLLADPPAAKRLTEEMIPSAIRAYVLDVALNANVPLEHVAIPVVVSNGNLIGRQLAIQPKRLDTRWVEVANLCGLIVADSGTNKSHALRAGTRLLEEVEERAQ